VDGDLGRLNSGCRGRGLAALGWAVVAWWAMSGSGGFLVCAMLFGLFSDSVRFDHKTKAEAEHRTTQKPKPNQQPKTEQTNILVR
jgi:phosphate/sulfate permease